MSVIISGTPNNIRLPTYITHIVLYHQGTFKHADPTGSRTMYRDISLVNNQQRNLDAHIGSYIFYEDRYRSNLYDNIRSSLCLSVCYLPEI